MRTLRWVTVVAVALTLGGVSWAQDDEKFVVRGHAFYSNPTGDGPRGSEADTAFGFDMGLELLFRGQMGFNFTVGFSDHDINPPPGKVEPTPVTGTVLFHLTPSSSFDVYVGPGLAVVFYDDINGANVDTDLAIALLGGIDIPLRVEGLSLSFDIRYIGAVADIEGIEFDVDPWIFGAGVAFRF